MTQQEKPVWIGRAERPINSHQNFGLMGILNLTPDSFYDGGRYQSPALTFEHLTHLLDSGADVVDIGAQSTRPDAAVLDPATELERLQTILPQICKAWPEVNFSIDTVHAAIAAFALQCGVGIVNDVSALETDPALADVLAQYKPAYVLMHNRVQGSRPVGKNSDIIDELKNFFAKKLNFLVSFLPEEHIVLDPGIGFCKTMEENLALLQRLQEFLIFGRPLLVGISMKSLFGHLLGLALNERAESTAITSVILWQKGAFWHRVHNVAQARNALVLAEVLDSKMSAPQSTGMWS